MQVDNFETAIRTSHFNADKFRIAFVAVGIGENAYVMTVSEFKRLECHSNYHIAYPDDIYIPNIGKSNNKVRVSLSAKHTKKKQEWQDGGKFYFDAMVDYSKDENAVCILPNNSVVIHRGPNFGAAYYPTQNCNIVD